MSRDVDVVIVAYGAPTQLERCLSHLDRELAVTVVDNSSSPQVAAVARRHGATYIDNEGNRGFATAVNVALVRLAHANSDVLLLNPDAVIDSRGVRDLARFLHSHTNMRVAAVAPRLQGPESEQRVAWPLPTPLRMWAEALGFGRLPARHEFVVGAVLLLRREALNEIGRFDERFFLYAEEADWQRRAQGRGWTSAVCSAVVAEHTGAGSSTNARRREVRFHAAHELYVRKWYGSTGWCAYRVAACVGAAVRMVVLRGDRREGAASRLIVYLRGPCRCAAMSSD
jgi:GT2 family glycosyltransferase